MLMYPPIMHFDHSLIVHRTRKSPKVNPPGSAPIKKLEQGVRQLLGMNTTLSKKSGSLGCAVFDDAITDRTPTPFPK